MKYEQIKIFIILSFDIIIMFICYLIVPMINQSIQLINYKTKIKTLSVNYLP